MYRSIQVLLIVSTCFCVGLPRPLSADEPDAARQAQLAIRRAGPAVMCHRGSWEFAHENTLEAYRATFELGADGNEIDVRATRDGVLICFHDDSLEMLLDAFGDASDYDWAELQSFSFRNPGRYGADCRIPTLEETMLLHKKYGGLMQLDVKRPSLEPAIIALLDQHDMWDHVVSANNVNAPAVIKHPKFKPLGYKASLIEERQDMNPQVIKSTLDRPGQMIMVDDPRAVLGALGRKPKQMSTKPYAPVTRKRPGTSPLANAIEADLIQQLINDADWNMVPNSAEERTVKAASIQKRAEAAEEIRRRGLDSPEIRAALIRRVERRSLHPDWRSHGLDSGSALRTLAELEVPEFANLSRKILWLDDPANESVLNPEFKVPRSWTDFRTKFVAVAMLDRFHDAAAEQLCQDYLALGDEEARRLGPVQYEPAARALLTMSPTEVTAAELLRHRRGEVRGRTILICLSRWEESWAQAALRKGAPFALELAPKGK
ncbi:MAG: glycerophosphodiester phosphodiesterase [Planctomycetaceae bacterium]